MTSEEAVRVLDVLVTADDGNEVVMLEVLNNFVSIFPEWAALAKARWTQETGKEFKRR